MLLHFRKLLFNAAGDAPPVTPPPPPAPTPDADKNAQTKAYSELHNEFKSFKVSAEKTERELRAQLAKYQSSGKTVEQLAQELADTNIKREEAEKTANTYKENISKMLETEMAGLDDKQKKMVTEFASDDNFKRLNFVKELKGQQAPTPPRNSQGSPVIDNGNTNIDVATIVQEAGKGNMKPYREAIKTHGQKAKDAIAKATQKTVTIAK